MKLAYTMAPGRGDTDLILAGLADGESDPAGNRMGIGRNHMVGGGIEPIRQIGRQTRSYRVGVFAGTFEIITLNLITGSVEDSDCAQ